MVCSGGIEGSLYIPQPQQVHSRSLINAYMFKSADTVLLEAPSGRCCVPVENIGVEQMGLSRDQGSGLIAFLLQEFIEQLLRAQHCAGCPGMAATLSGEDHSPLRFHLAVNVY